MQFKALFNCYSDGAAGCKGFYQCDRGDVKTERQKIPPGLEELTAQ